MSVPKGDGNVYTIASYSGTYRFATLYEAREKARKLASADPLTTFTIRVDLETWYAPAPVQQEPIVQKNSRCAEFWEER